MNFWDDNHLHMTKGNTSWEEQVTNTVVNDRLQTDRTLDNGHFFGT